MGCTNGIMANYAIENVVGYVVDFTLTPIGETLKFSIGIINGGVSALLMVRMSVMRVV